MSVDDGLRRLLRQHVRRVHWTSVETGHVQQGVPDLSGCGDGQEFWVECKSVRRGHAVKFRPGQPGWLLAHERHGGRTFVAVRRRTETGDDLVLYRGHAARELVDRGLLAPGRVGEWSGGPAKWDWTAVRVALVG